MNVIIGFQRLNSGDLWCDGINSRNLDFRSWRQGLAVVSQQVVLFSGTLRDNICYGVEPVSEEKLAEVIRSANLTEVVAGLPEGLNSTVGENGVQLSGGQRQRIAIARALIRDPKVIILDEATSALDVISERAVQEAIDRLVVGRTTLIVAHRLSTIRQADWIVVMEQGRVVEQGPRESLLAQEGAFAELLALQH
jgi:ATP-binding cassette subfamily B protein